MTQRDNQEYCLEKIVEERNKASGYTFSYRVRDFHAKLKKEWDGPIQEETA